MTPEVILLVALPLMALASGAAIYANHRVADLAQGEASAWRDRAHRAEGVCDAEHGRVTELLGSLARVQEARAADIRDVVRELRSAHAEEVRALQASHAAFLDATVNRLVLGAPQPAEARVELHEDPELRVRQHVHEDTIRRGMADLRRGYEQQGLTRTDDELREEVTQMMRGLVPTPESLPYQGLQGPAALTVVPRD